MLFTQRCLHTCHHLSQLSHLTLIFHRKRAEFIIVILIKTLRSMIKTLIFLGDIAIVTAISFIINNSLNFVVNAMFIEVLKPLEVT